MNFIWFESETDVQLWIFVFSSISISISSLEIIFNWESFKDGGVYDWKLIRSSSVTFMKIKGIQRVPFLVWIALLFLTIIMVFFHFVFLANGLTIGASITSFILAFLWLLILTRLHRGLDGSDQMIAIILVSLALGNIGLFLFDSSLIFNTAISFIAIQSLLSYFTTGYYKLVAKAWRNGENLIAIMNTKTYGIPSLAPKISTSVSRLGSIFLILWEVLIPLLFLLGGYYLVTGLIIGILFHILAALVMRLNTFLWSFLASYPAVLYFRQLIEQYFNN